VRTSDDPITLALAELLDSLGWRSHNDAQWDHLHAAKERIAALLAPKDGGPAIPIGSGDARDGTGMSLRDYLAAKAMQGIVSSIDSEENYERLRGHAKAQGLTLSQWIARDSYKQADAMLAVRGGGS
jgi:hypothetical protein